MENISTYIVASLVIIPGLFLLGRSIKNEALEGKCASCCQKHQCQNPRCSRDGE